MDNFSATIEYIDGQCAAIVTMYDPTGEWSGGGRIDVRPIHGSVRSALYENGYTVASLSAKSKGGRLDRYTEVN